MASASPGNEAARTPTPTPAVRSLRTPPSLAELSRKSTSLLFIPYLRELAAQTADLGLRMVLVHVNFLDRRIRVSEDRSGGEEAGERSEETRIPASKKAIEAMATVGMVEIGWECAICLKESVSGGDLVKQMPCGHKYHSGCIEKWLGIHGSCPVCRYEMPCEEHGGENKENEFSGIHEDATDEDDDDDDDEEDGDDYFEEAEYGGDSYENGAVFHYLVNGSTGQVLAADDIDIVPNGGDDEN